MKKSGFTLVEMVAVILIMALLTIIVLPTIINQIRSQKENISETAMQLISNATELYLSENEYSMRYGETYCISLETLVNDGKLKSPLMDFSTGKEIPLNQVVKTVVNEYGTGEYSIVDTSQCKIELLSTPEWKAKSFEDDKVILTYGFDRENTVAEAKCYYGKTSDSITNLGSSEDNSCVYPSEAAYAKVCTINDKGIESCSEIKKLADYLILDGEMLVEFATYKATLTPQEGYLSLEITGTDGNRRGIYMKDPINLTNYAYIYADLSATLKVPDDVTTANPSFELEMYDEVNLLDNSSQLIIHQTIMRKNGATGGYTQVADRKVLSTSTLTHDGLGYFEIRRNKSGSTEITSNIYNVWLQLSE